MTAQEPMSTPDSGGLPTYADGIEQAAKIAALYDTGEQASNALFVTARMARDIAAEPVPTPDSADDDTVENDRWTCGGCGYEGNGPDNVEWTEHTKVCPDLHPTTPDADDDTVGEREAGLQARYRVQKINDPTRKHDDCGYFVLDPQHDPTARHALAEYARRTPSNALRLDLMRWLSSGTVPATPDADDTPVAADGEECHRCGGANVVWSASSPLWNYVMRGNDITSIAEARFDDMVCMPCFVICAVEAGLPRHGWRLTLTPEPEGLIYETPSGRTWDPGSFLWHDADVTPPPAAGDVEALAVALCDTNDSWAHLAVGRGDHPCLNCKAQAARLLASDWLRADRATRDAASKAEGAALGRRATLDPGAFVKRGRDDDGDYERIDKWQARAMQEAIEARP